MLPERILEHLARLAKLVDSNAPDDRAELEQMRVKFQALFDPNANPNGVVDLNDLRATGRSDLIALADFIGTVRTLDDSPPERLYHYTTFEGLQGILSSNQLWATEVSYLNDSAESLYPRRQLSRLLEEEASAHGSSVGEMLAAIDDYWRWLDRDALKFVTSFCEDDDLLSMWRGYAANGGGFSLGFDGVALNDVGLAEASGGVPLLLKVLYGDDMLQHRSVVAFRNVCHAVAETQGAIDQRGIGEAVANYLDMLFCRAKDYSFREEREWRRVVIHYNSKFMASQLLFRRGQFDVKPFLALSNGAERPSRIPLKSITIGPALRPVQTLRAVTWLLEKHGLQQAIKVIPSKVPYQL